LPKGAVKYDGELHFPPFHLYIGLTLLKAAVIAAFTHHIAFFVFHSCGQFWGIEEGIETHIAQGTIVGSLLLQITCLFISERTRDK